MRVLGVNASQVNVLDCMGVVRHTWIHFLSAVTGGNGHPCRPIGRIERVRQNRRYESAFLVWLGAAKLFLQLVVNVRSTVVVDVPKPVNSVDASKEFGADPSDCFMNIQMLLQ